MDNMKFSTRTPYFMYAFIFLNCDKKKKILSSSLSEMSTFLATPALNDNIDEIVIDVFQGSMFLIFDNRFVLPKKKKNCQTHAQQIRVIATLARDICASIIRKKAQIFRVLSNLSTFLQLENCSCKIRIDLSSKNFFSIQQQKKKSF